MASNIKLRILSWNADGIKAKIPLLSYYLHLLKIDVLCLQETHLSPSNKLYIPGYFVYRSDRTATHNFGRKGGVAIAVKNTLEHYHLNNLPATTFENVRIIIKTKELPSLQIASVYKRPNKPYKQGDLFPFFNSLHHSFITGDFNAKHSAWGSRLNNSNGSLLLNDITNYNLLIHSQDSPTHYSYINTVLPDILDFGLSKNIPFFVTTNVLTALPSDHRPISFSFSISPIHTKPEYPYHLHKINWSHFQILLDFLLPSIPKLLTTNQIDQYISLLQHSILDTLDLMAPSPIKSDSRPPIPLSIHKLILHKRKIRNYWLRHRSPYLKTYLNFLTKEVRKLLYLNQANHIIRQSHYTNINDSSLWNTTRRILKKQTIIPPLFVQNQFIHQPQDKCDVFADYLSKTFTTHPSSNLSHDSIILTHNSKAIPTVPHAVSFISPFEVLQYIEYLKPKLSYGPDLISPYIIKQFSFAVIVRYAAIFNSCLRLSYFPTTWKVAHVIPILKSNKSPDNPLNYRPISLLSSVGKVFEKCILYRLNTYLNSINAIPHYQFGFRTLLSTNHQILRLTEDILLAFQKFQYVSAVFLDIEKAFDTVWHPGLLYKLSLLGVPQYLHNIIKSFLQHRTFHVRLKHYLSVSKPIHAGVPQGAVLSPTLFNVYLSDFPTTSNTSLALFADDSALYSIDSNLLTAISFLQNHLNLIETWALNWHIKLNVSKCNAKIFSLRRYNNLPPLLYQNETIPWLSSTEPIKYLGVLMDRRLHWRNNIINRITLANKRWHQLLPLVKYSHSLNIKTKLHIYLTMIRPILTYACPIWGSASKTNTAKIQTFQNSCLRTIVKAPWYIPNNQIHNELGVLPIPNYFIQISTKFYNKINNIPSAIHFQLGKQNSHHNRLKRKLPKQFFHPP